MTQQQASSAVRHFAREAKAHSFDLSKGSNPRKSHAGQFYLDCLRCRRSIFEDGSGSAAEKECQ
jgi:hypothetical protein